MNKETLKKITMIFIIIVLAILNVFVLAIQIVNAEEEASAKPIIEGMLEKYINYNVSEEDKGTLVQYHLRTGINYEGISEVFPIKSNETMITMRQIDGKYPYKVSVIVNSTETTNGNSKENYATEYSADTGILTVKIYNQDENGNIISSGIPSKDNRDDYTIIGYYDTYTEEQVERQLNLKIGFKTELFSEEYKEIYGKGELKKVVTENIGDLTSIDYSSQDVYNGYMKSNIINGTEYNTQYTETESIIISKKEAHQKIEITEDNTFIRTNDVEIIEDLGYEVRKIEE